WRLEGEREVQLLFSALDIPYAEDPGGLTRQQVRTDRRHAVAMARQLDAGQKVTQQRLGLLYTDTLDNGGQLRARAFAARREFDQQLPFPGSSLIDYQRWFYGTGVEYLNDVELFSLSHRILLGADVERQEDDRGR